MFTIGVNWISKAEMVIPWFMNVYMGIIERTNYPRRTVRKI